MFSLCIVRDKIVVFFKFKCFFFSVKECGLINYKKCLVLNVHIHRNLSPSWIDKRLQNSWMKCQESVGVGESYEPDFFCQTHLLTKAYSCAARIIQVSDCLNPSHPSFPINIPFVCAERNYWKCAQSEKQPCDVSDTSDVLCSTAVRLARQTQWMMLLVDCS